MDHFLAYIDPGSGSLIIQALIAGIVAVPFFFRQQISRFVHAIRRSDATPEPQSEAQQQPDRPS